MLNTEFDVIKKEYEEAQENHKAPKEWLKFQDAFPNQGKQGIVGLATTPSEHKVVYKMSQYIDFLAHHELLIMSDLERINWCPHFCKAIGGVLCEVPPDYKSKRNILSGGSDINITPLAPIEKEVMLMEYIEDGFKLSSYIKSKSGKEDKIYSLIKQTLMAISVAQKECSFTHYDLHSNNVMVRDCDEDLCILYVIDEDNHFLVPTLGYYPTIIDYGFSYSSSLENSPLYASMGHTEVGFMSDRFDKFADPKLFLITVSGELDDYKRGAKSKAFSRCVKNMFAGLKIEWDCAWDKGVRCSASDYVRLMMKRVNMRGNDTSSSSSDEDKYRSRVFYEYDHYAVDLLQVLIDIPLKPRKYDMFDTACSAFFDEWTKLENVLSSPHYCLYILKGMVIAAKKIEKDYYSKDKEIRKDALIYFSRHITDLIHSVAKFCSPKIHYEKLLCSMYCLARCIEGILYKAVQTRMEKKQKRYERLPLQTIEEMFVAIDVNIEDNYMFNKNTNILVVDRIQKKSYYISPSDEDISELNEYENLSRGGYLYEKYCKE